MTSFDSIVLGFFRTLSPLQIIGEEPEDIYSLVDQASGHSLVEIPMLFPEIISALSGIRDAVVILESNDTSTSDEQKQEKLLEVARGVMSLVEKILNSNEFPPETLLKILEYLIVNYLSSQQPLFYNVCKLIGIIDESILEGEGRPISRAAINFNRINTLLTKPKEILTETYKWDTNEFDFLKFAFAISSVLGSLGMASYIEGISNENAGSIDPARAINERIIHQYLKLALFESPDQSSSFGLGMFPLLSSDGDKPGIAFMPYGNAALEQEIPITDQLNLFVESSLGLAGGIAIKIRPDTGLQVITGFETDNIVGLNPDDGSLAQIKAGLRFGEDTPYKLIEFNENSGLSVSQIELAFFTSIYSPEFQDIGIELSLESGELTIRGSENDGFLNQILGSNGIEANFDLTLGFSFAQGVYFKGSGGIEINLPTQISLGPLEIRSLLIRCSPGSAGVNLELSAVIAAKLGPVGVVVERMGLLGNLSFPPNNSGNLGPLDLSLGFKPPNGLGLSLDAGAVKGGGYLYFDFDREEYAGALELVFSEWIALKAIGVITTKMPDGSKGFSMVIIITAEFGSGLQLGLGFTLLGVGGIIGINRVVNVEPLKDGVRTGAIESVLFPQDVVANAPRIISDLKAFFPVREGQFLIGPMAKIGYGTPTLASLSLGLIIEFPDVNITILGVLKIVLPDENADVLRLQVNFLGRIEPANSLLWFYAELYDSRVLFITLEGGMGLLVNWGNNSNFVFSVGGFHPQFTPPPLPFPAPPRLAVNILNETYARVRIEGYFAVTSNSVQFGARVEVFFGVSAFNIDGHFGFDALFQFDPFYFSFSLSVSLSVKLFGMGVFSIGFSGLLEGPTPWHIKGQGSIGFLFFSVSVPFEETWGEQPATPLPPIEIFPLIEREFNAITNWQAVVPTGSRLFVSLRKLDEPTESAPQTSQETDKRPLVLHPVGSLRISQRKMPLDFKMDKLGNQMPADVNEISIAAAISGADAVNPGVAKEKFARGEYQNLDQAKKLSEPAFELYNGGLELKADGAQLKTSMAVKRIIRYETIIIDSNFKRHAHKFFEAIVTSFSLLAGRLFGHFVKGSVITKSTVSAAYQQRIQPNEQVITVELPKYSVALMMDNSPLAGTDGLTTASFASKAEAFNFMQSQITGDPKKAGTLHIIPNTELNQSTAA